MTAATDEDRIVDPARIDLRRKVLENYFFWLSLVESDSSLYVIDLGEESICFFDVLHKINELDQLERYALAMFVLGFSCREIGDTINATRHTVEALIRQSVGNLLRAQAGLPLIEGGPGRGRRLKAQSFRR